MKTIKLLFAFIIFNLSFLVSPQAKAQGCFSPATNFPAGTSPQSVVMGDFNNDSKVDMAVANSGSNNVSVFLGNGAGSFTTTLTFAVGTHPISVISAYLDADFIPDLAVANYNSNNVSVLIGDGTGNFGAATNYAVGSYPISITSTYLLSGYMDLAVANVGSNNVSILKNYGNGYFATAINYTVGAQPASITNADFNGDGYKDLVTANYTANNVSVLFGASTGGFATATNFAVGTNPKSVISDDFNGDSKADLAVANYNSNGVSILLGTGTGSFSAATNFSLGTYPTSIISDYFNGDGFMDLAVANYTSNNVSVMLGDGAGSFGAFGVVGNFAVGTGPISITRADFNGDGKADIATANYGSNDVSILFGAPLPTVTANASGTTVCSGTSVILTGGGAVTYGWTGGVSDGFAFPLFSTQTYTVSGTDVNGCVNSAVVTINLSTPSTPNICMVTSDSLSVNNIIYWDKTFNADADSFIIYREVSTSTYHRIGAVSKDSLSQFVDANRAVGPANGNPNIGYYHYKLQVCDSCGNYGAMSPYHTSVFFIDNHNGTFTWNTYDVEGSATPVANFNLMRDSANIGDWHLVGSVAGTTTTLNDPTYATYQAIANWRVDATGFYCNPTLRLAGNNSIDAAKIRSHSNQNNNRTTGINRIANSNEVSIYPNPASTHLTLTLSKGEGTSTLQITDMMGNTVKQYLISNVTSIINIADLAEGVYTISISSNEGVVNKRVVIVR